jgi:hypothetical protein
LDSDYLFPVRALAAELGAAVRESSGRVQQKMVDAITLTTRFPTTTTALREARITARHAGIIREHGARLPDGDVLEAYERKAVGFAEDASVPQLRVFVKTLADQLLPETITQRHERARKTRGVWMRDLEDGMAELGIVHSAAVIHGIHDRLTRMGKAIESDERRQAREAKEAREAELARAAVAAGSDAAYWGFRDARTRVEEHGHRGLREQSRTGAADALPGSRASTAGHDGLSRRRAGSSASIRRDAFGQVLDDNGHPRHPDNPDTAPRTTTGQNTGTTTEPDPDTDPHTDADADADVDARSLDELRADIAADLLLTGAPTAHVICDDSGRNLLEGIRATVQVAIPATTLTGTDDTDTAAAGNAAFLAGHGPIDPHTARRLAGTATGWDRLFRHPDTGVLLTVDRYTPTELQKRFLKARDETCRFPCCRTPASRADADHTIDWQYGGETNINNLGYLCRAHHMVKHHTPWTVTQLPGGVLEWTSPLGTTYPDVPQPTVRFVALDTDPPDPPPF